ncbi:MAG: glycosyltransferase [Moheibacter sp.]
MEKFSLLIAHYNNFEYFKECHQSIQNQSFKNFEIIIVDDYSSDDSFQKLKDLAESDSRIKLFQNKKNQGVGFTKRKCVELASGEICAFVDPDDALAKNALELSLEKYKNPKIVATHSDLMLCDEKLNQVKKFPNTGKVISGNAKFFNINFEVNHFFTFRKSIYEKTDGINQLLTSAVDQDLYLKIYEKGKLAYIPKPLYLYRLHQNGVSQNKSKKEKLNRNWQAVLKATVERRNIQKLYGKNVNEIENLPKFIFQKQNSLFSRILKKIK